MFWVCRLGLRTRGKDGVSQTVIDSSFSNSPAATPGDATPPAEKKYKPLNTTPNATKEIKVKIIPPQRESEFGECALSWEHTLHGNEWPGGWVILGVLKLCTSGTPLSSSQAA